MKTLGSRLRILRKKLGLNQVQFAKEIRVSRNTVGSYETNMSAPDANVISTIVRKYNVRLDWLILGKGNIFVNKKEVIESDEEMLRNRFPDLDETYLALVVKLFQLFEYEPYILQLENARIEIDEMWGDNLERFKKNKNKKIVSIASG